MFMDVYAECFGRADDNAFFLVALSVCATCNELRAFSHFACRASESIRLIFVLKLAVIFCHLLQPKQI